MSTSPEKMAAWVVKAVWFRTELQEPPSDVVVLGYSEQEGYGLYDTHECDGHGMCWGVPRYGGRV